jgi:hypothetical protein
MKRLAVICVALAVAGCTRSNMDSQPKDHEYEASKLFRNGRVLQAPVPGTVARGDLARAAAEKRKPAVTRELLARGQGEYNVNCAPCHDRAGTGNGIVVQRGFPKPASFHDERLRMADDQHLYDATASSRAIAGPSSPISAPCN